MPPISSVEIKNLNNAVQYFQDCYLVSSIAALSRSSNGRKILAENIAHTDNGYRIHFNNINGESKDFFVTTKEVNDLTYTDKYRNDIPIPEEYPHNPVIKAIEVAMNKLLKKYPSKKPLICRFANCNEAFEFNKPSNFLEMFTGRKPLILNENTFSWTLKSRADESKNLFNKISDNPDNSFVAGTFYCKKLHPNHCYSIVKINKSDNTVELFDHRRHKSFILSFQDAIKNLKFIVGYFNNNLP